MLVHSPIVSIRKVREYEFIIDPHNMDPVDTICAYIREIYREAEDLKNDKIKELCRAAYDKANRMDRGLKKYRKRFLILPKEIQEEMIAICK